MALEKVKKEEVTSSLCQSKNIKLINTLLNAINLDLWRERNKASHSWIKTRKG